MSGARSGLHWGTIVATPLEAWVEESARLTKPAKIVWCDGSEEENERHLAGLLHDGILTKLNPSTYPHCYLHRRNPNDVARTESVTFICTKNDDAGPTNNWMAPEEAREKLRPIFDGSMKGRTMYVAPYILGPANSPYSRVGVEITDSRYVVASMRIMSRMGKAAFDRIGNTNDFVPGLHALADVNPERRFVLHFPEEKLIWSVGSGYGGNALLGKKCFALRIASWMARSEGWMAEHMLVLGLEDPSGKVTYMAAAFPSACGKTNLAMMVSALESQGYRVWTIGDDIAWMHIASDGTLRAVNPEAGFFGVAPGTNKQTNPNVMSALSHDTIFTNVAISEAQEPWWEGIGTPPPPGFINWKGEPWASDRAPPRIPIRVTRFRRSSHLRFLRTGKSQRAYPSPRSFSEDAANASLRSSTNRTIGSTEFLSAPRWRRKPPLPPRAISASRDAIPWQCFPSAATTWRIISLTGWKWASEPEAAEDFPRQLVPQGRGWKISMAWLR